MKSKCQKIFSNLRIKNQIILLQLFVLMLSLSLLVAIAQINNYLVTQSISTLSLYILKNLETSSLESQSIYLERGLHQYMLYQELQLDNLNSLFNYIYNQNETFLASDNLLRTSIPNEAVNYIPYFNQKSCETENLKNLPTPDMKRLLELFIKQMNTMFLTFKYTESTNVPLQYLTTIYDDQYFALIPPYYLIDTYRPHQRPWYINHQEALQVNPDQNFVWSKPFKNMATQENQVTLTRSLVIEKTNIMQGVLGVDTKIFSQKVINEFAHIFSSILSLEGEVYSTNCNFNTSKVYFQIYDTETTGFNQQDWEEVLNHYKFHNGTSNCGDQDGFHRYNLLYQECFSMKLTLVHNSFYILNFISSSYIHSNLQISNKIQDYIQQSLSDNICILAITGISLFCISYLFIIIFIYPFKELLKVLTGQIQGKKLQVDKKLSKKNEKQIVLQNLGLTKFGKKIFQLSNQKSRECQIIQRFIYPQNNKMNFPPNFIETLNTNNLCIKNQQKLYFETKNFDLSDFGRYKNLIIKLLKPKKII